MSQTFNENKFKYDSFYEENAAITRFKYGHDNPILETELNEMQIVQDKKMESFFKKIMPSGFLNIKENGFDGENIVYCPPDKNGKILLNHICIAPCEVIVNGQEFKMRGNFTYKDNDNYILIDIGEAPQYIDRDDFVYLEFWYEIVDHTEPLRQYGYQDGNVSDYSIVDKRISEETSRRIALKWNVRVYNGANFDSFNNGFGYNNQFDYAPIKAIANGNCIESNLGDYVFAPSDNDMFKECDFYGDKNLWVAGRPNIVQTDGRLYGNYIYGLPMFKINRRNKQKYSIDNYNGSMSYIQSLNRDLVGSIKDGDLNNNIRPDKLFYDIIVDKDLIDIRRLTNHNSDFTNNDLNLTLNNLFNNNLFTNGKNKMKRIQIGNISPDYNSNSVNLFIKFDKSITPYFINESEPSYEIKYKEDEVDLIYEKSINSYGLDINGNYQLEYDLYNTSEILNGSLDFFIQPNWFGINDNKQTIVKMLNKDKKVIELYKDGKNLIFNVYQYDEEDTELKSSISVDLENTLIMAKNIYHVRLSWSTMDSIMMSFIYINGKMVGQENLQNLNNTLPKKLIIGSIEDSSSFVIEDLLLYNNNFEVNIGDHVNKVFLNDFWPNLPKDYVKSDTIILPSLDGKGSTLSDNKLFQQNVVNYEKIIDNRLVINVGQHNTIDENFTPEVYSKNGNILEGNWEGLGTSNGIFTLSSAVEDEDSIPDQDEILIVRDNLTLMNEFVKYETSSEFYDLIEKSMKLIAPQYLKNGKYAIIMKDVNSRKMRILDIGDINNPYELFNGVVDEDIYAIDAFCLLLKDIEFPLSIPNNSVVTLDTQECIINRPNVALEILGNIDHPHYSDNFKNIIENSISIEDRLSIEDGRFLIYSSDNSESNKCIKIRNLDTTKEDEYSLEDTISLNGLSLKVDNLDGINNLEGVIINTISGDIVNGRFNVSTDVSYENNYDASLKDAIDSSIEILNQDDLIDCKFEITVTSMLNPSIKVVKFLDLSKETIYEGAMSSNITCIPGIKFGLENFPEFTYNKDSMVINTFAKIGETEGHFSFMDTIKYDDNYSDKLKDFLLPNISITDEFLMKDNNYDLVLTDHIGSEFLIKDNETEEILFEGGVGSEDSFEYIPGVKVNFSIIPPKCNIMDTILIKTKAIKFENVNYSLLNKIPFTHFSEKLYELIVDSIKVINLGEIIDEDYVVQLIDEEVLEVYTIDGEVLYTGPKGHNFSCIPGILFNVLDLSGIDKFGAVVISTSQTSIGIDVIVKYNIYTSNGNSGFDIQNKILEAGILKKNFEDIEEISFNLINGERRDVNYIRPHLEHGADSYDLAYDYSNSLIIKESDYDETYESKVKYYGELDKENHNGFVRKLIYHVTPTEINTYLIPSRLYGYEVIGIISIIGNSIVGCEKVVIDENKYFKVTLRDASIGRALKFEIALGGMSFEYEPISKTLMRNTVKTFNIEFESTGKKDYEIPLTISKYGHGLIVSPFCIKNNKIVNFEGKNINTFNYINVAYVDDNLFIDKDFSEDEKVLAEYVIHQDSFEKPVLKISFLNTPKLGTKITVPVLTDYFPKNDIISLWYDNTPYQGVDIGEKYNLKRLTKWNFFATTLSSFKNGNMGNMNNIINRLPGGLIRASEITGEDIRFSNFETDQYCNFKILKDYITNDIESYNFLYNPNIKVTKTSSNYQDAEIDIDVTIIFSNTKDDINKYIGAYCLVETDNKEIMLFIIGDLQLNKTNKLEFKPKHGDLFRINNSPISGR